MMEDEAADQAAASEFDGECVRGPGELWRIEGSLAAVRSEVGELGSLDEKGLRARLAGLEGRWRSELDTVLPQSLVGELHELLDWSGNADASVTELRLGLAQLEGWLAGVISGMGFVVVGSADS